MKTRRKNYILGLVSKPMVRGVEPLVGWLVAALLLSLPAGLAQPHAGPSTQWIEPAPGDMCLFASCAGTSPDPDHAFILGFEQTLHVDAFSPSGRPLTVAFLFHDEQLGTTTLLGNVSQPPYKVVVPRPVTTAHGELEAFAHDDMSRWASARLPITWL